MKNLATLTTKLPTVKSSYATFDIIGNTIGRYFDYQKETAMIKAEIKKVEKQTEVILKKIDAELQKILDLNDKNFKLEMRRLSVIENQINIINKRKEKTQTQIDRIIDFLVSKELDNEKYIQTLGLINSLNNELHKNDSLLANQVNGLRNFNTNILE